MHRFYSLFGVRKSVFCVFVLMSVGPHLYPCTVGWLLGVVCVVVRKHFKLLLANFCNPFKDVLDHCQFFYILIEFILNN